MSTQNSHETAGFDTPVHAADVSVEHQAPAAVAHAEQAHAPEAQAEVHAAAVHADQAHAEHDHAEESFEEAVEDTGSGFEAFGLSPALIGNIARLGFKQPTTVQIEAIPAAMQGGDWMVSSQTGSGKTAAFLLPVLNAILAEQAAQPAANANVPGQNPWVKGEKVNSRKMRQGGRDTRFAPVAPKAIVLCPTRELAQQVAADAINFVHGLRGLRVAIVVGGVPFVKQVAELQNASVVVATPGRLLDLQNQGKIQLEDVKFLVVDEADRMLDLGFQEDLEMISNSCGNRDQTLMFSATFAPRIMQLASAMMNNPGRLELATAQDRHTDITQTLHWADGLQHKKNLLGHWLREEGSEQILVFASTQVDTELIADELVEEGYNAAALHGAMPQHVRNRRLQNLRDGRIKILVATDVAARGIDVPTISHVINFGLPMKAEDYVHRIGRTGRAGRSGKAITIAEFRERHKIRAIEQYTQQQLVAAVIPGLEPAPRKNFEGPRRDFGRGPRNEGYGRQGGYPRQDAAPRQERGFQGGYQGGNRQEGGFRPDSGFRSEGGFKAEVREFRPAAPRQEWKPAGYGDQRAGGFAEKTGGYQGRPENRNEGFADRGAPERSGGWAKPAGGFAGKPSGGYQGRADNGGFAGRQDNGGYAGKPAGGGFAGKPAPWANKAPGQGFAGKSEGYAGKPAGGGFAGKPAPWANKSAGGFAGKPAGFGARQEGGFAGKPAGTGYAGKPAGGFAGKPEGGYAGKPEGGFSKPLYAKRRAA